MKAKTTAGTGTPVTLDDLIDQAAKLRKRQTKGAVGRRAVGRTVRATRSGTFRWRYQLAPLAVICATWVAGVVLRMFTHPVKIAVLVTAAVTVGWWLLARRLDRPVERRYGWACVTYATTWLTLAAAYGLGWQIAGRHVLVPALWAGGLALALPWWKHYRIRPTTEAAQDLTLAEEWRDYVAAPTMALPESRVVAIKPVRNGTELEVALVRGKHTTKDAIAATERVTSAFDRETGSVSIEASRTLRATRARVLLIDRNPLHKTIPHPGPHLFDPETGTAPLGIYVDGEHALYRFYRPGSGPCHDLIAGSTDAGKSTVVDGLFGYERHSGIMASLAIDPQEGQSFPDWQDSLGAFARGTDEGLDLLARIEGEMFARNRLLAGVPWTDSNGRERKGVGHFDSRHPAVIKLGLNLWCLTIDEAHLLLAIKQAATHVKTLVGMSRKCGIKIRLLTQVPLLSSLGGHMEIRDAVAAGNVICLRTANGLSGQVSGVNAAFNATLPVQPHQLPREWPNGQTTAGIGYTLGPAARPAMMRHFFVEDPYRWAHSGATTPVEWLPTGKAAATTTPKVSTTKPAMQSPKADPKCRDAIMTAMRGGSRKRGDIIAATGLTVKVVADELAAMVAEGAAAKDARSLYELVEATQ